MEYIEYFKLQAKNFYRDFCTKKFNEDEGFYEYFPRFFEDIDEIIISFNIDEEKFSLMKAQHLIACLAGFSKWSDILHASEARLELGKLLIENRNNYVECGSVLENWKMYEDANLNGWDDESKLDIFKIVMLGEPAIIDD